MSSDESSYDSDNSDDCSVGPEQFKMLSVDDAAEMLSNARCIVKCLLKSSLFRFYLHYCLALHPHKYPMMNYPTDIRLYDRKMWSSIATFHRRNTLPYVSNYVYWKCVVLLVAHEGMLDIRWKELLLYMCTSHLPRSDDMCILWGEAKSHTFLSGAGDIYEAIAGFCMPNTMDSRGLRTLFERNHGWKDIEAESQTLLCQMGKLAKCIHLLVSCAPWFEQQLHALLTNHQIARIKSTVGDTGNYWKSHWVEVFWPELSSSASSGAIRGDPDPPSTVEQNVFNFCIRHH